MLLLVYFTTLIQQQLLYSIKLKRVYCIGRTWQETVVTCLVVLPCSLLYREDGLWRRKFKVVPIPAMDFYRRNGSKAPLILILEIKCWWLVSVKLRTHYSRRKPSRYLLSRRLCGTELRYGRVGENTDFPLAGFKHRSTIGDRLESKMLPLSSHVFPFVQLDSFHVNAVSKRRNTGFDTHERHTQRVPGVFAARNSPEENVTMAGSQALVSPYSGLDKSSAFHTSVAKQTPPQRSQRLLKQDSTSVDGRKWICPSTSAIWATATCSLCVY